MRTIIVIYTNTKLDKKEQGKVKKYSFNTDDVVSVDNIIESKDYTTRMQVVKVLDKAYKYYNASTGELSDEYTSTAQWEIRTLILKDDEDTAVYGKIIQ